MNVAGSRIAIVDPGSFILPYDFQLVKALAEAGHEVDFYGSTTRYNGEFVEAMRGLSRVNVRVLPISRTMTTRWQGGWNYLRQLLALWRDRHRYATINLQFSGAWPLEWLVFGALRSRFVYTVHNAVPHGFEGQRHPPTLRLASLARSLIFVSQATHDDFMARYGDGFRSKSSVMPHGVLPVAPQAGVTNYDAARPPRSLVFWSTVKAYKGVEIFKSLAQSKTIRERSLSLAVYGAWDASLAPLRSDLASAGVALHEGYLDTPQLLSLLSQDAVFLLPYQRASQSGALYALLNHGRLFICADTGDLGAFMRRYGLEGLLLKERSAEAVVACLDYLAAHEAEIRAAFNRAQQALQWPRLLAEHGQAYGQSYESRCDNPAA